ncbi:TetR/AcrR family transcriptional regulator [Nocardia sp. NBC_01388]|uniref:TetR/AcrR family transcriptional regulator n=1 Tax=Nocardia sp. NBC_01388 TaxID=2903596 RepID=UPI00324EA459
MEYTTVWRGSTMEDRSNDRREMLIDAGFNLLGTAGAAGTTVTAVCRDAGLSRRYFYENFAGREELLVAVQNRLFDDMRTIVESNPMQGDIEQQLHALFVTAAVYFEEDPRRVRIVCRESFADHTLRENLAVAAPPFILAAAGHFAPLMIDGDNPAATVSLLYGGITTLFIDWLDGRVTATHDEVANACTQLVLTLASPSK